ncbi:hypothetical protein [Bacteroides faecis]|uniref:hypothetical protein n=1 Tax=Bacteroides faecis TaxID=674529 RepID=UPI00356AFA1E
MKHLFFALGHGERTDFMQDFCVEYDSERSGGVEIARKTCKVKPCYLSVSPRRFAKK